MEWGLWQWALPRPGPAAELQPFPSHMSQLRPLEAGSLCRALRCPVTRAEPCWLSIHSPALSPARVLSTTADFIRSESR